MREALGRRTQDWFEERFHADLNSIRIHKDPAANAIACGMSAEAFTIGEDIFFAAGRYAPGTSAGRELLAHELTHALQQRRHHPYPQSEGLCEAEAAEAALAIGRGARWESSVPDRAGQLRRAATIKPGSALLKITSYPAVKRPAVTAGKAVFECSSKIKAEASVILIGSQPAVGWTLGFIQAEWIDTNWLYYRGQHDHDGSIFFQRSRPPARPIKACRDVAPESDIFYTDSWNLPAVKATDSLPLTLRVNHEDNPSDGCKGVEVNSKTGKDNFLREAQLEFLFCTVLTARDPTNKYYHLKSFYWNVRWQARYLPVNFGNPNGPWHVTPVLEGQGQATSHVIEGTPTDARFKDILTDPTVRGCDAIIPLYTNLPPGHACRHESTVWTSFDVRK